MKSLVSALQKEKVKKPKPFKKKAKGASSNMMKMIGACILIFTLFGSTIGFAQTVRFAYTFESLTVSSTAVGFTSSKLHTGANQANVTVFTVNCASGITCVLRFTVDGTTPTASVGMRALYGDTVTITGYNSNSAFRAIRETSTDVKLDVTYFR